jgi:hypothetical protein
LIIDMYDRFQAYTIIYINIFHWQVIKVGLLLIDI